MSDAAAAWVILGQLVVTVVLLTWVELLRQDLRHERTMRTIYERLADLWATDREWWRKECFTLMEETHAGMDTPEER
jgi:rubrerythrin